MPSITTSTTRLVTPSSRFGATAPAIEARRQAILLLDSIEMNAAADSLRLVTGEEWKRLNVKKQFFERKLQEDLKKK